MAVIEDIFAHARRKPEQRAVVYNGVPLSYRAFAARIVEARRFLAEAGADREPLAVLLVGHLEDAWIVGFAARSLGLTTVNARSPKDVEVLSRTGASIVTTTRERWPGAPETAARLGARYIQVPVDPGPAQATLDEASGGQALGGHIMLTSGTTGVHKKVLIEPRLEASHAGLRRDLYGLTSESVVNVFDFGCWTAAGYQTPLPVWSVGGTVVFHQAPERWRSLTLPGLTMAYAQPQFVTDLLSAPPDVALRNDAMMLIIAGGVLPAAVWRETCERITRNVWTGYGSTEVGPTALTHIDTADDLQWHRGLPDVRPEVVDEQDRPLPVGKAGILRIRNSGVTGYLDDDATTRMFFRDGYFYPGDLAVVRADGRFSLQGRTTDVINVRGFKIATMPIETLLRDRLEAVDVCVLSAQIGDDDEVVHVVIQPKRPIEGEELRQAMVAALPRGTRARVLQVGGFPRNDMGKIDRARLTQLVLAGPAHGP